MGLRVERASEGELDDCLAVRREVFIVGQSVAEDIEIDGLDPDCEHWLARLDGEPVGTARARFVEPDVAKIERVAVLASCRGRGIGHAVMDAVEKGMAEAGAKQALLASQCTVEPFYAARGYVAEGEVFLDADIDHRYMRKPLAPAPRQTG